MRPVVHYMMGGVHTDIDGATPVAGLYAAGETACVSLNGANRLGSNSLTECLVFGARAGRAAAPFAREREHPRAQVLESLVRDEEERLRATLLSEESGRTERVSQIRTDLQSTMESGAGIYRTAEELTAACEQIRALKERYQRVSVDDRSLVFNTQLTSALELGCMLDVAETVAHSALLREESRGSHARSDHESRDDERYLSHSLAHRDVDGGDPGIEYLPATITRWQPEERKY